MQEEFGSQVFQYREDQFYLAFIFDNLGLHPSIFMSLGYSILALSVMGFFIAIIWNKTKNLWLVMAIHAFGDLLPNLPDFIKTWGIN